MLTISKSSFSNLPESTHVHSALALSIEASDEALTEAIARADRHAMRPMPCDRASRGNLRWTVVGFSAIGDYRFCDEFRCVASGSAIPIGSSWPNPNWYRKPIRSTDLEKATKSLLWRP